MWELCRRGRNPRWQSTFPNLALNTISKTNILQKPTKPSHEDADQCNTDTTYTEVEIIRITLEHFTRPISRLILGCASYHVTMSFVPPFRAGKQGPAGTCSPAANVHNTTGVLQERSPGEARRDSSNVRLGLRNSCHTAVRGSGLGWNHGVSWKAENIVYIAGRGAGVMCIRGLAPN